MAILFELSEFCCEEIAEEIFFVFCFHIWPEAQTLALSLISRQTPTVTSNTPKKYFFIATTVAGDV